MRVLLYFIARILKVKFLMKKVFIVDFKDRKNSLFNYDFREMLREKYILGLVYPTFV